MKLILMGWLLFSTSICFALDAKLSAKAIATKVDKVEQGDSSVSFNKMILKTKRGESIRSFYAISKNDQEDSLIHFTKPSRMKGTALLSEGDSQWLYLPALKKARRISTKGKGRPFVGSEIYFEDFKTRDILKDNHKRLKDAKLNGKDCYVISTTPGKGNEETGYDRWVSFIDPEKFVPLKVIFYKNGKKLKYIEVHKLKKISNIWTSLDQTITDYKTGSSTQVIIQKIKYNKEKAKKLVSKRNLESFSESKTKKLLK